MLDETLSSSPPHLVLVDRLEDDRQMIKNSLAFDLAILFSVDVIPQVRQKEIRSGSNTRNKR